MANSLDRRYNQRGLIKKEDVDRMKEIVDLMQKFLSTQKENNYSVQQWIDIYSSSLEKLKKLGFEEKQITEGNLGNLKKEQIELEKAYIQQEKQIKLAIKKEKLRETEQKRAKIAKKTEKEFNEDITKQTEKQIKQQKELDEIKEKVLKKANKLNISEKTRNKIIEEGRKEYDAKRREFDKINLIENSKKEAKNTFIKSIGADPNLLKEMENGQFSGSAYALQLAANTFSKAVDVFKRSVKDGFEKNYNTTEQVLNRVIGSNSYGTNLSWTGGNFNFNGKNYTGYSRINNAIVDKLKTENLYDNIANTDVMENFAALSSSGGLGVDTALAKGFQDTVIKYIVPYLDTSSATFTDLEMLLPGISQNIAGTALNIKAQLGENRYIAKYNEQLVKLMEPVSLQASSELYSEEYNKIASQAESLLASGVFTSAEEAQNYVNQAFQMYMNPTGSLQSGSLAQKMTAARLISSGNINSPSAYFNGLIGNTSEVLSWGGENSLTRAIVARYGLGDESIARTMNNKNIGNKNADNISAKEQQSIFLAQQSKADDLNTTTKKIETQLINATRDISEIKTILGSQLYEVATFLLEGIGTLIMTKIVSGVIGKGIGLLSGSDGASKGILAGGGGIAVGAFSAVATLALIKAITDKDYNNSVKSAEDRLVGTNLEGNNAAKLINTSENMGQVGFIGTVINDTGSFLNNVSNSIKSDIAGANSNRFSNLQRTLSNTYNMGISPEKKREYALAFMLLLASENRLSDIGTNEAELKTLVEDENGPSLINAVSLIGKSPLYAYQPHTNKGKIEQLNQSWLNGVMSNWNYHRTGLNEVPYDNYPAMLHQGEAVLTSATANEIRNLVDEYRNTSKQNVQFETIIQTQTVALVDKMTEIVSTIKGINNTRNSEPQSSKMLLTDSMRHMTSTKLY